MMKFALGLAILGFTAIFGSYVLVENMNYIEVKQNALLDAIANRERAENLQEKFATAKNNAMKSGNDQKFTIERNLGIGANSGLEFKFIGQARNTDEVLYNHTFRISGESDFPTLLGLVQKLSKQAGFATYSICYGCQRTRTPLPAGHNTVMIEGYLYVYNPEKNI